MNDTHMFQAGDFARCEYNKRMCIFHTSTVECLLTVLVVAQKDLPDM